MAEAIPLVPIATNNPEDIMSVAQNTMDANASQSLSNENQVIYANDLVLRAKAMATRFSTQSDIYSTAMGNVNAAITANTSTNIPAANSASATVVGAIGGAPAAAILASNNTTAATWASTLGTLAGQCGTLSADINALADQLKSSADAVVASINEVKSVAETCDSGTEIAAGVSTVVALGVASQVGDNPYAKGSSASGTQLGVGIAGGVGGALINSQLTNTKTAASTSNSTASVAAAGICGSFFVDGYEGISYFNTAKTVHDNLKTDQGLLDSLQSANSGGGGGAYTATMSSGLPDATDPSPGSISVTQQGQIQKAVKTLKYLEPITFVEAGGYSGLAAYCGFQCFALYGKSLGTQQSALRRQYGALNKLMAKATTSLKNYNLILSDSPGTLTVMGCPLVPAPAFAPPIAAIVSPTKLPPAVPLPVDPAATATATANLARDKESKVRLSEATAPAITTIAAASAPTPANVPAAPTVSTPAAVNPNCDTAHFADCVAILDRLANLSKCLETTANDYQDAGCGGVLCNGGESNAQARALLKAIRAGKAPPENTNPDFVCDTPVATK